MNLPYPVLKHRYRCWTPFGNDYFIDGLERMIDQLADHELRTSKIYDDIGDISTLGTSTLLTA